MMISVAVIGISLVVSRPAMAVSNTGQEAYDIGLEAYLYFYPLVLMDVTRRQATNVEPGKMPGRGPANTFIHVPAFPPADYRDVVRPNYDTLYSVVYLDLTDGPIIISTPDTGERFYMLEMLDMWTDAFANPGKRTTGTKAGNFALVPPDWIGNLPDGVTRINSPTGMVWVIGRTQTNGAADYKAVHKIQAGFKLTKLSEWGKKPSPVTLKVDPNVDMKTPPMLQVKQMSAGDFFTYAAELMKVNPPHSTDFDMVARLKRIGIVPGQRFDFSGATPAVKKALERAVGDAIKLMQEKATTLIPLVNGWQVATDTVGVYGNAYLRRAIWALVGLGANQPEDAVYPLTNVDSDGKQLDSANKYILRLKKDEIPPVDAFWSLTLYDKDGFPVPNEINRQALGDRDKMKFGSDGSLDIYMQASSPGKDKEGNWLPTPKSGPFSLALRLYMPRWEVLNGMWTPPAVRRLPTER